MAKINPNIKSRKNSTDSLSVSELCKRLVNGDRYALSRAITIVESESKDDEAKAHQILSLLLKEDRISQRIGISGAPGSGKSTLIEALGMFLISRGMKPAVLAIDPSSSKTGGSILGDKTRMNRLSQTEDAFIRPSPSGNTLGGVARKTRESIILLEAAGYDPILVETVGVGQSETMVKSMTDIFVLLISPGGGDEIQGIKRGIMELADILLVNKMDGKLESQAEETLEQYKLATPLIQSDRSEGIDVFGISALESKGIEEFWTAISTYFEQIKRSEKLSEIREGQNLKWFEDHIRSGLFDRIVHSEKFSEAYFRLRQEVTDNEISAFTASQVFFELLNNTDES